MTGSELVDLAQIPQGDFEDTWNVPWGPGSYGHERALKSVLPNVEIIAFASYGEYQGDCAALLKYGDRLWIWKDYFGSCGGCDGLENASPRDCLDYIRHTLLEAVEVPSKKAAIEYLNEHSNDWDTGFLELRKELEGKA